MCYLSDRAAGTLGCVFSWLKNMKSLAELMGNILGMWQGDEWIPKLCLIFKAHWGLRLMWDIVGKC